MTPFHRTESLSGLFFDETLTVLGTAAYWWLTYSCSQLSETSHTLAIPAKGSFSSNNLINESFGVWVNVLLLGVFDGLTATGSAFVVLLAVMDSTVFDDLLGAASGAG
jgi:hypothetical protein